MSQYIPFYGDRARSWPEFLIKAAKGSAKAFDIVLYAELAFMVDVARDGRAIDWDQSRLPPLYARQIGEPPTVKRLLDAAAENAWVTDHLPAGSRPNVQSYGVSWGEAPVNQSKLLIAAAHRCAENWSAKEITSVREQSATTYDAAHLVSAMLLMSYSWPEPPSYTAGFSEDESMRQGSDGGAPWDANGKRPRLRRSG